MILLRFLKTLLNILKPTKPPINVSVNPPKKKETSAGQTSSKSKKNMNLTREEKIERLRRPNFKPEEFFHSDTANKLGIDNFPKPEDEMRALNNLDSTADLVQEIRDILCVPIHINSGYRCLKLNNALPGASKTSDHMKGCAVDIIAPKFGSSHDILKTLHKHEVVVDQCFCEGTWLHVSRRKHQKNRMMYGTYLYDAKLKKRVFKKI